MATNMPAGFTQKPSGFMGFLQNPQVRATLLHTGLGLLAQKDERGSLGGALGRALPYGLEAGRQAGREAAYEAMLEGAPPQMQAVLQMLGPDRGAAVLAQQMMQPRRTTSLAEGALLVDEGTGEVIAENEAPEEFERTPLADGTIGIFNQAGELVRTEGPADGPEFGDIAALRNRFESNVQPFEDAAQAFRKLEVSATGEATPAKDIALIFNYMKAIDPASTVREGEFATAQNAGSAWTVAGNLYNRLLTGQRLNATQRAEFLNSAREQLASQLPQYQTVADQYREIAEGNGFDPSQIIRNPFAGLNLAPGAQPGSSPDSTLSDEEIWKRLTGGDNGP